MPMNIEVEDLTKKTPKSELAVAVRFGPQDRCVEVFKSGTVRLVSPAGTVSARFKEQEKRDLPRQSYIETLLSSGVQGEELEQALEAISHVDRRLAEEEDAREGIADVEHQTEERVRTWAEAQGLDYDALSEDEFMALVQRGVAEVRRSGRETTIY